MVSESQYILHKYITESIRNAFENGYGPDLAVMDDKELADDIVSYNADAARYPMAEVLAVLKIVRREFNV